MDIIWPVPQAGLILKASDRQALIRHAETCCPEECCGILGGRQATVQQVVPVENAAHSATRYRMDPEGQIRAMLELEAQGLELVGIYHSHPAGPSDLSDTDLDEARYPDCVYLVLSPGEIGWQILAFRLEGGSPKPFPVLEGRPKPEKLDGVS